MKLTEFLGEFNEAMIHQLEEDEKRWGNTWQQRPKEGQEIRIKERLDAYFDQNKNANQPIPWLKIACLSLIAWVRENKKI
jgi:hypothetical protein